MKIDDASSKPGLSALPPANNAAIRAADKAAGVPHSADKVSLSPTLRALTTPDANAADAPFDAARVEAIRTAIANGQFRPNPDKIADGLIESVRSLVGRSHDGQ